MAKGFILFFLVFSGFVENQNKAKSDNTCISELRIEKAGMVDLKKLNAEIQVDLKYSGTDNFVGIDVYGCLSKAYLQKEAAIQLSKASFQLKKEHPELRLLVYDAARPKWAQKILWDSLKKPESQKHVYVANPKIGSIHNYGCAVDLTLCYKNGNALDMGTPYDFFGLLAQPRKEPEMVKTGKLTQTQLKNRKLLRKIMMSAGYRPISSEWWHFNYGSLRSVKARFRPVE